MTQFRRIVTGLTLMVVLFGGHKCTNAATNDTYELKDMFQTVVTPTEWSTDQAQHDQLPDIRTMPKLDKEAVYLFYREIMYTSGDYQKLHQIRRDYMKPKKVILDWGDFGYKKYDDGLLEFDFYASKDGDPKAHYHFFQDQEGKNYEQIPPNGKRNLVKKWVSNSHTGRGNIEDYQNHIKWSGYLEGRLLPTTKTLEFTEFSKIDGKEHCYNYKAEFEENPALGGETKFKATHISSIDGKAGKPVVTTTVYKGLLWPILIEYGKNQGFTTKMKTFKTIER